MLHRLQEVQNDERMQDDENCYCDQVRAALRLRDRRHYDRRRNETRRDDPEGPRRAFPKLEVGTVLILIGKRYLCHFRKPERFRAVTIAYRPKVRQPFHSLPYR